MVRIVRARCDSRHRGPSAPMTYRQPRGGTAVRRPRRRDGGDIVEGSAALFAVLPVWAPLVALGIGDGAVALAFPVFHWPVTLLPTAILAVTLFFGVTGIGGLLERARRRKRLAQARSLDALRALSWQDFEHLVLSTYAALGWSASLTQRGADGGVDIILKRNREKLLVQCKLWKVQRIRVDTIRSLHSVIVTEHATGGIVVSCGTFTNDAVSLANAVRIECVDGPALLALIASVHADVPGNATTSATDEPPACPACAREMIRRHSSRGPFWGCSAYPSCRGIIDIPS
jgi:restriction system protein